MSALIDQLKRFNRKERFFLVGLALDNPDFTLGAKFRSALGDLFDPKITIPPDAFVAMDYHLEWLYAAIRGAQVGKPIKNDEDRFVRGNQEDIDLLVAFDEGHLTHVILVEAKGDTAWGNKQMQSKANRLRTVFSRVEGMVVPHFAFASPNPPQHLKGDWPKWINTKHFLPMPVTGDLRVSRCDAEGVKSATGDYWMVAGH